jgi:hypothetical protein
MSKLFLDVLGNGKLVDGYQIDDSIAQKYNLKPGTLCPFTRLRVEILSPRQVREVDEANRRKQIKQKKALGKLEAKSAQEKDRHPAGKSESSGYTSGKTSKKKNPKQPSESHDSARRRARTGRRPVKRNRILKGEEVRMATEKKAPAKKAKAVAKTAVKAKAKAAAKPKAKVAAKAKAKAPAKAKAAAKKPAAKKPAKAKK